MEKGKLSLFLVHLATAFGTAAETWWIFIHIKTCIYCLKIFDYIDSNVILQKQGRIYWLS